MAADIHRAVRCQSWGPVFAGTLLPGKNAPSSSLSEMPSSRLSTPHHLRFLVAHSHLSQVFGGDWFAKGAKSFARFFGTPFFLMAQSAIVCGLNR